jgi:hypothetical protein
VDSPEPDTSTSSSARSTSGAEMSSPPAGPESPSTPMSETLALNLRGREEGARPELDEVASLRAASGGSSRSYVMQPDSIRDRVHPATEAHPPLLSGGQGPRGHSLPLISSVEGSPAKTSPSQDDGPASPATEADSSMSTPESLSLFDPDGYSSRTFRDSSPHTAVGTSESSLARWPTSGTAWAGGFSTHVSSECRSVGGECSSSEPALTEILEPPQDVHPKYSLSARAAHGILRRAEKRGRALPPHLLSALSEVAASQPDGGSAPTKQQPDS